MLELIDQHSALRTAHWTRNQETLALQCATFPQQDEFLAWANAVLKQLDVRVSDIAEGADRVQVHFVYASSQYILCFEGTCEAIWISGLGKQDTSCIALLFNALSTF